MDSITNADVSSAINEFLARQLQAKSESGRKKLAKAEPDSDEAEQIKEDLAALRERYSRLPWLQQAADKMAKQLKFGSHIAKGIHPDSKGDNINFRTKRDLPEGLVGSQLLQTAELDANGNAAALPLAAFFNTGVKGVKLRDLILSDHLALKGVFADDVEYSDQIQQSFYTALAGKVDCPASFERNKQLLWPQDGAVENDSYHCLVPLYPSALTHKIYHKINGQRFSDENKQARENRKKITAEQSPYVSIVGLAATHLGGTKPQNVSLLTSKQGGRNYLMESLPPTFEQQHSFAISKKQEAFFNKNLAYHCRLGLQSLFDVVEVANNIMEVRDQRKEALGIVLGQILQLAAYVQNNYKAGWSEEYPLKMAHKYWLDPGRAELEEQDGFKEERDKGDWVHTVMEDFSLWLNKQLKARFKHKSTSFDDAEYREWLWEMEKVIKASQRAGQGIF